jgi:zinc transport system permease protein
MLREEWLAALGLAHLAAAGALLGLAAGAPAVIGGAAGALVGGAAKTAMSARGNAAYGFMILIGWTAMLLVAANTAIGDSLGRAMVDGQLYFAATVDLSAALILATLSAASLPWLSGKLLRARFFPRLEQANALPAWRWHLGTDLLAAAGMAVGTATLGLMGSFALVFVPAWLAFRFARGWRWTLIISAVIGIAGYLIAFLLALFLDQPFGPILVAALVIVAAAATAVPRPIAVHHRPVGTGPQPSAVLTARDRE